MENGAQYENCIYKLRKQPETRQAVMIYIRPNMHVAATMGGMNDFMCTTHVQYFLNDDVLDAHVHMRSNDAVYGYNNDYAWQNFVLNSMCMDLSQGRQVKPGKIVWNVGSLHIYPQHQHLIK